MQANKHTFTKCLSFRRRSTRELRRRRNNSWRDNSPWSRSAKPGRWVHLSVSLYTHQTQKGIYWCYLDQLLVNLLAGQSVSLYTPMLEQGGVTFVSVGWLVCWLVSLLANLVERASYNVTCNFGGLQV